MEQKRRIRNEQRHEVNREKFAQLLEVLRKKQHSEQNAEGSDTRDDDHGVEAGNKN